MPEADTAVGEPLRAGRYTLHAEIASGGMATVYYGQMVGAHGFSRVVAVKRMLPRLARDPSFHAMFVDEAKLASRVQHPNVVPILDVVDEQGDIMIVMEYVRGPSLAALLDASLAAQKKVPVPIVANIGCAMLAGLHAAHEARDRRGRTLGIVHRDVSPQNVLVGVDGVTRIMDFGVAKATHQLGNEDQKLTGKLCYMAPEQLQVSGVDRRTDVFATAVVLWSALAGRRLFRGKSPVETMAEVLRCEIPPLSEFRDDVPPALEAALCRALERERDARPESAEVFASAIETATPLASTRAVAEWVNQLAGATVDERDRVIVHIEKTHTTMAFPITPTDKQSDVRSDALTAEWLRAEATSDASAPAEPTKTSAKRGAMVAAAALVLVTLSAFAIDRRSNDSPEATPAASVAPPASAAPAPPAPVASVAPPKPSATTTGSVPPVKSNTPKVGAVATSTRTARPPPTPKPNPSAHSGRTPHYPAAP